MLLYNQLSYGEGNLSNLIEYLKANSAAYLQVGIQNGLAQQIQILQEKIILLMPSTVMGLPRITLEPISKLSEQGNYYFC